MSESVIADDLKIKGEVTTQGDVELKGTLEGEIVCRTLLIAEDAKVDGKVTAEKVVVRGSVDGQINGIRVTLAPSAKVRGELVCKALSVDEEAYFDGTSQRVNDPLGLEEDLEEDQSKQPTQGGLIKGTIGTDKSKPDKDPHKETGEKLQPLAASASVGH